MAENLEVTEAANTLNDERARRLADRAARTPIRSTRA